jgi:hypothetical protein
MADEYKCVLLWMWMDIISVDSTDTYNKGGKWSDLTFQSTVHLAPEITKSEAPQLFLIEFNRNAAYGCTKHVANLD